MSKNHVIKWVAAVICSMILLTACAPNAFASASESGSIHIDFKDSGTIVSDAAFRAYYVADMLNGGSEYSLVDSFADSGAVIDGDMTNDDWMNVSEKLADWASKNNIAATMEGKTDSNGSLTFSNLRMGLYLICGDSITIDDNKYDLQPFCVAVPDRNEDGTLQYNVSVVPKFEKENVPPPATPTPTPTPLIPTYPPATPQHSYVPPDRGTAQTNDTFNYSFWISLMLIASGVLVLDGLLLSKKRKNNEE